MVKEKVLIRAIKSSTEHLQPVIDYIFSTGNWPAGRSSLEDWYFDNSGYGEYNFSRDLPIKEIKERFDFPEHIVLYENDHGCAIRDKHEALRISGGYGQYGMSEEESKEFFDELDKIREAKLKEIRENKTDEQIT